MRKTKLLSASAAALKIGVTRSAVSRWVSTGMIPSQRIGNILMVDLAEVRAISATSKARQARKPAKTGAKK